MPQSAWCQVTIAFPEPHTAEAVAATHLAPILIEAVDHRLINAWFYVRKGSWRLRYRPSLNGSKADAFLHDRLALLRHAGRLTTVIPGRYEPETHAFGGTAAMKAAHELWHHDSHHLLTPKGIGRPAHHRELSVILCAAMMRAAGLDRYEQGDVWARLAEHRDPPDQAIVTGLQAPVRRLLTVDPDTLTRAGAPLAAARDWFDAYTTAGATLGRLAETGQLHRGLRDVLTHHVIFAWNRRGIPGPQQAALATAAKALIFGPDPTTMVLTSTGAIP